MVEKLSYERHRGEDADWLDGLIQALETFRTYNPDVTVNQVLTFLYVAREPGITQKETLEMLDMWAGGSSRIVAALSKYGDRYGNDGWDAIRIDENPKDRRFKNLNLTQKGKNIVGLVRTCVTQCCKNLGRTGVKGSA